MEKCYWHICTDGLSREIIFKSEEAFIFGMNGVPVYSFHFDVTVMAFCLMSNHVHFITYGSGNGCRSFIRGYRKRLSCLTDMSAASASIKLIDDTDYLMKAIGYVLRNPVGAGEKVLPTTYRWGSGPLYFNDARKVYGTPVSAISNTMRKKLIRSHLALPDHCIITPDGMVDPGSYVDYRTVETLYGHPGRFLYHISRRDDMEMELTGDILHKTSYTDAELLASVSEICRQEFLHNDPAELSIENRFRLAGILRKRYGLGPKQLGRLTKVDPGIIREML